ncbi:hypothetical protein [Indiicoccus explosivorum]|uniref:hypothetical protein n=1 Tax=Indiicoccus explosivorum TaxID=1917864 RepID=UPI000B43AB7A|nr:hypothetical protein [Indiicoccus explosivorum]
MRKIIVFNFFLAMLTACSPMSAEKELPIEMIAFNSLSDKEQELIPTSPKDSVVIKKAVSPEIQSKIDSNYDEEEIYLVVFNNTATATTGNLVVFIDLAKRSVVGKGVQELD